MGPCVRHVVITDHWNPISIVIECPPTEKNLSHEGMRNSVTCFESWKGRSTDMPTVFCSHENVKANLHIQNWTAPALWLWLCRVATNVKCLFLTGPGMYPDHRVTTDGFKSYLWRPRQNIVTVAPVYANSNSAKCWRSVNRHGLPRRIVFSRLPRGIPWRLFHAAYHPNVGLANLFEGAYPNCL